MDKDFEADDDMTFDVGSDIGGDTSSDSSDDIASDNGTDLNVNIDEDIDTDMNIDESTGDDLNTRESSIPDSKIVNEQPDVSSAERIAQAAMSNVESPKLGTRVAAGILNWATGNKIYIGEANDTLTRGMQIVRDGVPVAAQEFMGAAYRQHAFEPPPMQGVDFIYDDTDQMVPIKHLNDPLKEQDYFDENGVSITDKKLHK